MTITLRSEKADELTFDEMDENFAAIRAREISFCVTGGAATNEVVWSYAAVTDMVIPINFAGSQVVVFAEEPLSISFDIFSGQAIVGALIISENVATFSALAPVTLAPGDSLTFASSGAKTFLSIAVTIAAQLT